MMTVFFLIGYLTPVIMTMAFLRPNLDLDLQWRVSKAQSVNLALSKIKGPCQTVVLDATVNTLPMIPSKALGGYYGIAMGT